MIIQPKIRGFICTAAHPIGCKEAVLKQIEYAKQETSLTQSPKRVLVIGASTGYGLASRITAAFAGGAQTIGVCFEKEADANRTASPGMYNTAAFEEAADAKGLYAKTINGDAFSDDIKNKVIALIKKDLGQVDLIIYSLASPRRVHPVTGQVYQSTLKPIGQPFQGKTVDAFKGEVKSVQIEPASEEDIANTVAVMGGDDWKRWIDQLAKAGVLAEGVKTIAFSYLGPALTHAIYRDGTIGCAKADLHKAAHDLRTQLAPLHGDARIAVAKAVVTQASAAIPVVPLYIALLFKFMKEQGTHEGCIEQMYRLFHDYVATEAPAHFDAEGLIRLDDKEMAPDIQAKIEAAWPLITTENLVALTDIEGYRDEFYHLFGFGFNEIDYAADTDPLVTMKPVE